jgi:hypothetical protein
MQCAIGSLNGAHQQLLEPQSFHMFRVELNCGVRLSMQHERRAGHTLYDVTFAAHSNNTQLCS